MTEHSEIPRTKTIAIRVTPGELERLQAEAKAAKRSVSDFVRVEMIDPWLEKTPPPAKGGKR